MADTENKNLQNSSSTPQINDIKNQTFTSQNNSEYSTTNERQSNQDFTKIFSENINVESEIPQNAQEHTNNQEQSPQHTEPNSTLINEKIDTPENKISEIQGQPNTWVQTTQTSTENNQEKAQKEKLIQLIKVHEIKAQKKWLTKWILYGIALTIWIFALSIIFAKEQILNLLNNQNKNTLPLNASIVELSNENVQDDNEIETDLLTWDILLTGDVQDSTENDILSEDQDDTETNGTIENNNTTQENETIEDTNEDTTALENITLKNEDNTSENNDEEINENKDNNTENTDNNDENNTELTGNIQWTEELEQTNNEEEITTNNDEESTTEESNPATGNNYTITHVSSTGEANWVLPTICGEDIFCNNLHETFTPCIEFKQNEKLNDNANRIWNNWTCRFKDFSELVYITFN